MRNRDVLAKAARVAAKRKVPPTAKQARALVRKYSENQPRDESGKWTAGGAALTAAAIAAGLVALPVLAGAGSVAALNHLSRRLARQMRHTRQTYKPKPVRPMRPTDPRFPTAAAGALLTGGLIKQRRK